MGVFARLFGRSTATAEAPAAEAQADTAEAGAAAETDAPADTDASAEETAGAAETAAQADEPAAEAATDSGEPEAVDIPKQQSTEKAADNEAGESART
ncbi:hypothetical protein ACFC5X_12690 [Streptomyces sp. NPDC055952]|uniref:hypothetical protein n=1 Tax=Streptomyces sp. NPDC055952 TaxID=3345663 RepID=UPI0035DCB22E